MKFTSLAPLALLLAAPVTAQDAGAPSPPQALSIATANALGALLYRYDRVAWHGSDAFAADALRIGSIAVDGYLVIPGQTVDVDELWFYGTTADGVQRRIARYAVRGSHVIDSELRIAELDPTARTMIAARTAALREASVRQLPFCARANPNTVVLPPADDGSVAVYLLTPVVAVGAVPLGGHHRLTVSADGKVGDVRSFAATCEMVRFDPASEDLAMNVQFTSPASGTPHEIHAFAAHYLPFPLGVLGGGQMWAVMGGVIADPVVADPDMGSK